MARKFVVAGSVSQSVNVFLQSTTNGDGVISLTTGKIAINYKIGTTGAITTVPTVAANTSDAFTASGTTHGWAELSSVKMPGVYRLDIPNAAIASTPDVTFFIQCSTPGSNFMPVALDIQVISSGGSDLPADVILYKGMAQTSVNIGAMLTSVNTNVNTAVTKVTSIDTKVSSMNTQVTSILANVTSIDSKVSSIDIKVSSVLANVTSVEVNLATANSKLSSIDTKVSSMNTQVTSILANVTSIDAKVSSIDSKVSSVLANITSVETNLAVANAKLSSMDTMLTSVNTNMLTTSTVHANLYADHLLNRDMSVGTDSGSSAFRTARQSLRFLRNKWDISGTTLSIYKEDDATASWTAVVTTASTDANPISAVDPNGP